MQKTLVIRNGNKRFLAAEFFDCYVWVFLVMYVSYHRILTRIHTFPYSLLSLLVRKLLFTCVHSNRQKSVLTMPHD